MNSFDYVLQGNVDYFKEVSLDVLLNSRDENRDSLLSRAVMEQKLDCVKVIYGRCSSLLYCESKRGFNALHQAVLKNDIEILKFIINADAESQRRGAEKRLTRMQDIYGHAALMTAVDIKKPAEVVKLLYAADPDFHHPPDKNDQTPLMLCMIDFDRKEMFKLLLEIAPIQSKTPMRPNGWTVLHYAAFVGDLSGVNNIIYFCPDCLELVDKDGMNFVHVAAKYKRIEVVNRVLGDNKIPDSVLNMKDNDGNTPFHIAALSGDVNLTLCFLYDSKVNKKTVNKAGQRVLNAINFDYDKRRAEVLGVTDQVDQRDLKDQSDFDLVVDALIATVSFTAGITVPGGYISDGPNKGTAVLSNKIAFQVFVISNTFALLFSLYAVFSHYCTRSLLKGEDVHYQFKVATFCTLGAIYAMIAAFIAGSFAVLANSTPLAIPVCAICCFFYIWAIRPMWKIVKQERLKNNTGSDHQV